MRIAFFGSSLLSSYWNGAATYYRGILRSLHALGHESTFFEPDAYMRQGHRDMDEPAWAKVVVYEASEDAALRALLQAADYDLIVKASGVGVFDTLLEEGVLQLKRASNTIVFWDVDAPATLDRLHADPADPFKPLIPRYDAVFTYGGGQGVIDAYSSLGARRCVPIYNAMDPETHFEVPADPRFASDFAFLGNRLPDREARVDEFFFHAAQALPETQFLLGGSGWSSKQRPRNVNYIDHVGTADHNVFNCTPRAVLNISRESMARYGYSPATRVFEAAGAAACILSDDWPGLDQFLNPGEEILVARSGAEAVDTMRDLVPARAVGQAAQRRVRAHHTYEQRARRIHSLLEGTSS